MKFKIDIGDIQGRKLLFRVKGLGSVYVSHVSNAKSNGTENRESNGDWIILGTIKIDITRTVDRHGFLSGHVSGTVLPEGPLYPPLMVPVLKLKVAHLVLVIILPYSLTRTASALRYNLQAW